MNPPGAHFASTLSHSNSKTQAAGSIKGTIFKKIRQYCKDFTSIDSRDWLDMSENLTSLGREHCYLPSQSDWLNLSKHQTHQQQRV